MALAWSRQLQGAALEREQELFLPNLPHYINESSQGSSLFSVTGASVFFFLLDLFYCYSERELTHIPQQLKGIMKKTLVFRKLWRSEPRPRA